MSKFWFWCRMSHEVIPDSSQQIYLHARIMYVKWNTHGASYMCQLMREKVISLQNTSTNPSQQIHLHTHTQNGRSRCSAGASDMSQVTPNCLATSMATAFPPSMRMWRSMRLPWMPLLRYLPLALALARARARARTRAHAFFLSLSLSHSLILSLFLGVLSRSRARARAFSLFLSLSRLSSLSLSLPPSTRSPFPLTLNCTRMP